MKNEDPWAWMQPYDVRRFGEVILDKREQERWCRAVLLGGLPFMWRKAEAARNVIYDRLELRPGDRYRTIDEFDAALFPRRDHGPSRKRWLAMLAIFVLAAMAFAVQYGWRTRRESPVPAPASRNATQDGSRSSTLAPMAGPELAIHRLELYNVYDSGTPIDWPSFRFAATSLRVIRYVIEGRDPLQRHRVRLGGEEAQHLQGARRGGDV